jgi:hypothetical protein
VIETRVFDSICMFPPNDVVHVRDSTHTVQTICILLSNGQYFHIFGSVNAANVAGRNVYAL